MTTYSELAQWSEAFTKGAFGLFFLVGNPGHAKSYTIRKLVEAQQEAKRKVLARSKKKTNSDDAIMPITGERRPDDHNANTLWIEGGAVSAFKLYQEVYTHLDEMIVMDDCDQVYSDRNIVRLLKALCQTEEVKTVGWHTQNRQLADAGIPFSFKCRSRVAIIANHWHELSQHVGSLMSRGIMIEFNPSVQEVFNYVKKNKIIADKEILDFTTKNLWMIQQIDIRHFITTAEAKKAGLPWRDALAKSLGIRELLVVKELQEDNTFVTVEERASKFMKIFGLSRPMYYQYAKKLKEIRDGEVTTPAAKNKTKGYPVGQIA